MKKLTSGEIGYILGLKKRKSDWMFEGTLEKIDNGYGYHLTIYLIKPIYYIVRPLLTPFIFVYLVLDSGVEEAREELKRQWGRDVVHLYLHINENTEESYEKAKFIDGLKK